MLKVENLEKSFNGQTVLDGINFEVKSGEKVAIIGSPGSGKTTLLRAICRLTTWDFGNVYIHRKSIENGLDYERSVGVVLGGEGNINSRMTILQNLTYLSGLRNKPKTDHTRSATDILHKFGLEEYHDYEVANLSEENRQKAILACAILHKPAVLILDKPDLRLGQLSATYFKKILDDFLSSDNQCVIVALENLDYMQEMCNRVIYLSYGSVLFDGSVAEFKKRTFRYKLRLSMSSKLLNRLESKLMNSWKSQNLYWELKKDLLVLIYSETRQVLPCLEWVREQTGTLADLTIEHLSLKKTIRGSEN